jgi:hypothetical protein
MCMCAWCVCVYYSGFHLDPEMGSRGPNAAKSHLNCAPFGIRNPAVKWALSKVYKPGAVSTR